VRALAALLAGLATCAAAAAAPDDPLPTYELSVAPNHVSGADDPRSNLNVVWLRGASATTPYLSPDSRRHRQRYLLVDPHASDAAGNRGHDEWWLVLERNWEPAFPDASHGRWGRWLNFHNVAGDAGPSGGIGWGFGNRVSPVALDLYGGVLRLAVEPMFPAHEWRLPHPAKGAWHTYVLNVVFGRTDGTTARPGRVRIWVDGADAPAVDTGPISTLHRARGPDGGDYVQRWVQLWEGDYTSELPVRATQRLVLARVGKTLAEALADRPALAGATVADRYRGAGVNLGPSSYRQIDSRRASDARISASLAGAAPSPLSFGNTGKGSVLGTLTPDAKRGSLYRAPSAMTITALRAHLAGSSPTTPARAAVYAVSGGLPAALLAESHEVPVGSGPAWITFPLRTPLVVAPGRELVLALQTGPSASPLVAGWDPAGASFFFNRDAYADGFSPLFGPPAAADSRSFAIAAVGTAGSSR
jgi:hypothetical protein